MTLLADSDGPGQQHVHKLPEAAVTAHAKKLIVSARCCCSLRRKAACCPAHVCQRSKQYVCRPWRWLQVLDGEGGVVDGVYCIGDANGKLMLAHAASAQARMTIYIFCTYPALGTSCCFTLHAQTLACLGQSVA